jgi:hypothetical protein
VLLGPAWIQTKGGLENAIAKSTESRENRSLIRLRGSSLDLEFLEQSERREIRVEPRDWTMDEIGGRADVVGPHWTVWHSVARDANGMRQDWRVFVRVNMFSKCDVG